MFFQQRISVYPLHLNLVLGVATKLVFVVFSNETLTEHDGHVVDLAVRLVGEMLDDLVVGVNQYHVDGPVPSP